MHLKWATGVIIWHISYHTKYMNANMLEIVNRVIAYSEQHQLLPAQGTIVVALSGGADSLCLLHLLDQLCGPGKRYPSIQLHVAHLNHKLRGQTAAHDALAVARFARSLRLPITMGAIDVRALARSERRSIEDAARVARYRFLRSVAQHQPSPVSIAVAHHEDDQVETLILHWLRGGGIASMIGLQPRQQDIIRPLLTLTHADTQAYCLYHDLHPLEDESNADTQFLRNRIRHDLLPLLEAINPGIRSTLSRNAEVMQVDATWIETQVTTVWPTVIITEQDKFTSLRRDALLALPISLQRHLLRRVSARLCAGQSPLELRHYKLIAQILQRESNGEKIALHLPEHLQMVRTGDTIVFTIYDNSAVTRIAHSPIENKEAILPIPGCVVVPGTSWLAIAEIISGSMLQTARDALQHEDWRAVWRILASDRYGVYIDAASNNGAVRVRTRRVGDRMQPLGMVQEKKIQDILVDRHVPRAERDQIPLFFSDTHCIWLAGICLDNRVRLSSATQTIVRLSILSNEQTYEG
jgi:tRNA(Ile)-lysidine synthase